MVDAQVCWGHVRPAGGSRSSVSQVHLQRPHLLDIGCGGSIYTTEMDKTYREMSFLLQEIQLLNIYQHTPGMHFYCGYLPPDGLSQEVIHFSLMKQTKIAKHSPYMGYERKDSRKILPCILLLPYIPRISLLNSQTHRKGSTEL